MLEKIRQKYHNLTNWLFKAYTLQGLRDEMARVHAFVNRPLYHVLVDLLVLSCVVGFAVSLLRLIVRHIAALWR